VTGLYCYGIRRAADAAAFAEGVEGLAGAALSHVASGPLAMIVSPHDLGTVRRARRNLRAHLRALEAAMADGPVLPMRFGVVAEDEAAVAATLAPREAELAGLLERHDGLAEFGLRVSWPRDAALAALSAARPDLAERRRALGTRAPQGALISLGQAVSDGLESRRKAAERALLARLRPLAEDHVLHPPSEDVEALRADFLLAKGAQDGFARAAEEAASVLDFAGDAPPRIRLVGPAPAYNFLSLHLDRPAEAA